MNNYLVIGGSSGIGLSIVNELEKNGHRVVASFNETQRESSDLVTYFKFNVMTDELDLDMLPENIDGFVYCPGTINLKPFKRFSEEDFITDYQLQVVGAIKILNSIYRKLKKSESASVVFFSTVAVSKGFPFHAQVAASKGALEGVTKTLASELAPTIRVNAVAPSLTQTPLAEPLLSTKEKKQSNAERNPLKRLGTAEDVANAVCFLLSEKSSYITGQILAVDGGMSVL